LPSLAPYTAPDLVERVITLDENPTNSQQRHKKRAGKLSASRKSALEEIGFTIEP